MFIHFENFFYSAFSLFPAAIVSALAIALQELGRIEGKEEIQDSTRFPFHKLFEKLQPGHLWESTLFTLYTARFTYYLIFAFISFYFAFVFESKETSPLYSRVAIEIGGVLCTFLLLELLLSLFIRKKTKACAKVLALPASLLIIPLLPFVSLFFLGKRLIKWSLPPSSPKLPFKLQDKLLDYLAGSELGKYLEFNEKKLIHTTLSFKDRIVREVMVPRIDVFSLSAETSLLEAARHFSSEGYSRIPVYKENVDKIIGVLLYKDILSLYTKSIESKKVSETLEKTVEQFVKPVLYTPETKKIAVLLQEFRNKQIHLAIVVDEYGGTEGIVTIEDILEELVGNIEDEYDTQEEKHFSPLSSGGWLVDAKMNILDLEENLNIHIPTSAEYDTIGGFIFHRAGSIPSKGWKIHLDNDVDLEVLKSDERSIRKIKITQKQRKSKKPS